MSRHTGGARQQEGGGQGTPATGWGERLGGRVVAGRVARWAAHGPHAVVDAVDCRGAAAAAVLATARGPHAVSATQSDAAPGVQGLTVHV